MTNNHSSFFYGFLGITLFISGFALIKVGILNNAKTAETATTSTSYAIEPVHDDKLKVTCFMAKEISGNELISISCLPDLLILQSINVLTATNTSNTTSTK